MCTCYLILKIKRMSTTPLAHIKMETKSEGKEIGNLLHVKNYLYIPIPRRTKYNTRQNACKNAGKFTQVADQCKHK